MGNAMNGTGTSQLQYTGMAATAAAALMAAQPAHAVNFVPFDQPHVVTADIIKADGRKWVSAQIAEIEALPTDWDGYGAEPISRVVLKRMKEHLNELVGPSAAPGSIVPGADGSVQAEWHLDRASFGLLIEDSGRISSWVRPSGRAEIERFGLGAVELFKSAVLTYLS